jgi:excinuclease ABC subunit A
MTEQTYIEIYGAREHNLKNVDVKIPHNKLTVITGLSGSGKSSLAFDTLYAEGQRRYIETFSAYARNFLGNIERPEVDEINGLSPVIAIEQKTTNKNPRSTVGTTTEIYDFLRLLFARAGQAYSYVTGKPMIKYTEAQILEVLYKDYNKKKIYLLAPLVRARKGHYRELFESLRKKGFLRVRIDGQLQEVLPDMRLDRYKIHDVELVVDRLEVNEDNRKRLTQSLSIAMNQGNGLCAVIEKDGSEIRYFSRNLMCPESGIAYS